MKFSVDKCKVMHMRKTNLHTKFMSSALIITTWEQDLHVMMYRCTKSIMLLFSSCGKSNTTNVWNYQEKNREQSKKHHAAGINPCFAHTLNIVFSSALLICKITYIVHKRPTVIKKSRKSFSKRKSLELFIMVS